MATFTCNDIDGLILDMEEIAELPDDVVYDITKAGAEVVRKAHIAAINRMGKKTGKLVGSPKVKMETGRTTYALIYPQGEHHTYKAKEGGRKSARNADVGFVQEFGGHGNTKHLNWMRNANEECADETTEAEFRVYDAWLKKHNL